MLKRWLFAKRTRWSRKITPNLRPQWKLVSHVLIGAAAQIAKRKLRKKQKPPCAAFRWNNPAETENAFSAAKRRKKKAFSRRLTEDFPAHLLKTAALADRLLTRCSEFRVARHSHCVVLALFPDDFSNEFQRE